MFTPLLFILVVQAMVVELGKKAAKPVNTVQYCISTFIYIFLRRNHDFCPNPNQVGFSA